MILLLHVGNKWLRHHFSGWLTNECPEPSVSAKLQNVGIKSNKHNKGDDFDSQSEGLFESLFGRGYSTFVCHGED
jgi:hypothetical protein